MENQDNPFAAPQAPLEDAPVPAAALAPLFTSTQIATGTFFFGPLPGIYCLHTNFKALGRSGAARNTLIAGATLLVLLMALVFIPLPRAFPSFVVPLAYTFAIRGVADSQGMKKAQIKASGYGFQSNGKVLLAGVLGLLAFVILAFGVGFLAILLGKLA